jgi:hypothetical protein
MTNDELHTLIRVVLSERYSLQHPDKPGATISYSASLRKAQYLNIIKEHDIEKETDHILQVMKNYKERKERIKNEKQERKEAWQEYCWKEKNGLLKTQQPKDDIAEMDAEFEKLRLDAEQNNPFRKILGAELAEIYAEQSRLCREVLQPSNIPYEVRVEECRKKGWELQLRADEIVKQL